MDITYRTIKTTPEKFRLYQFRKQVFVDEEQRWKTDADHITDLYDSIEESVNLAALCNGKIIAALRVTVDSNAGLPADRHWDFKPYRSGLSGICANFGWLCCTREFRHHTGLIKTLIAKGTEQASRLQASHVLAVIHPPIFELLHHCFGVKQIGEPFTDPCMKVKMLPIHGVVEEVLKQYPDAIAQPGICIPNRDKTPLTPPHDPLDRLGFRSRYHFLEQALSRNIGILSPAEQERLLDARVAIPGLGGVGGQHLIALTRTGIGRFTLSDFDTFETGNINRQYGARLPNLDRPKLDVMVEDALEINPYLDLRTFSSGVSPDNVDDFLKDADLVADGMDFFNIDIRRLIFSRAREMGIPVVTAGPMGFSAALMIFMPDRGMDFDTYFSISDNLDQEEKLMRFFVGLAPKATHAAYADPAAINIAGRQGPSTGAGCLICSGVMAAEAVRILLNRKGIKPAPHFFQYDPFSRKFRKGFLRMGNRHPVQQLKTWAVRRWLAAALPLDLPSGPDKPASPLSPEVIDYLINAGCQAPSGDNCQPWKIAGKGHRIHLYLRPDADNSFFNVGQAASIIACGAAVENICLAATRYGLSATPALCPDPENTDLLARIDINEAQVPESRLARFVWFRHTNRTRYSGARIPEKDLANLKQSISGFPDARLALIRDKPAIRELSGLICEADTIRTQRRDLHTHFMKMVRFSREQALLTRDGLPLKNLEAGRSGETFLKICRPWVAMAMANRIGLGSLAARTAARWTRQSSAMGLLFIRGRDTPALMAGGMALERLWLTATALGIAFQPMTAITLFRQRWDTGSQSDFSMSHQQRLGRIWPVFDHLFPSDPDETRIMLFRLGYGRPVSCRTLRRYQGSSPDRR